MVFYLPDRSHIYRNQMTHLLICGRALKDIDAVWGPVYRDNYARAEICDPNGYRIELRHWF